jgi:hypothetical protein
MSKQALCSAKCGLLSYGELIDLKRELPNAGRCRSATIGFPEPVRLRLLFALAADRMHPP